MTKVIIEIKPKRVEIDLDDYKEDIYTDEDGWNEDSVYDYFVHDQIVNSDYTWEIVE